MFFFAQYSNIYHYIRCLYYRLNTDFLSLFAYICVVCVQIFCKHGIKIIPIYRNSNPFLIRSISENPRPILNYGLSRLGSRNIFGRFRELFFFPFHRNYNFISSSKDLIRWIITQIAIMSIGFYSIFKQ